MNQLGPNGIVPGGFFPIHMSNGISVYRKDYAGGQPDYVTVVDLRKAALRNLSGSFQGQPNGTVSRKLMAQFWADAIAGNTPTRTARVLINGAFFATTKNPCGIAFGLKVSGQTISYGYGVANEFPNLIRTFNFYNIGSTATIANYSKATFDGVATNVVGALDPQANKDRDNHVGRTFVGVRDSDGNSVNETVLIYSSAFARQDDATTVLQAFGASAFVMMDGGGSTGLTVNGSAKITPSRSIPHAIAIYDGK